MAWFVFVWSDDIIEHIAEHGITPEDFEAVVLNPVRQGTSRSSGCQPRGATPRTGDT